MNRTLLALVLLVMGAATALAQSTYYDRNEVPGHYTLGLYADEKATVRELEIGATDEYFDCYVGVTGDSTKVFSSVVFRLELPDGVHLREPVKWASIPDLSTQGQILGAGVETAFNNPCQGMRGPFPVQVGRIRLHVDPSFREATIVPLGHKQYGLSVELCQPDNAWPKPYATGLELTVRRKLGFFDRLRALFD